MTVEGRATIVRRFARVAVLLPLAAVLAIGDAALSLPSGQASAQGFGNFFDRVFGGRSGPGYREGPRNYQPPPRYYIDPPVSRRQRQKAGNRGSTAVKRPPRRDGAAAAAIATAKGAPAAPPVEKTAEAKAVLVVGDFMALSLAKGLEASTAANAGVRIVDRTDGSSGLVRDDHFDWPQRIGAIVDEEKPAAVVVMLGSNDRQTLRTDTASEAIRSEGWTAEYTRRTQALAKAVAEKKLPLIWVGLPAFKSARSNDDIAYFNELYRQATTEAGAEFVDVWDGFVDANGAFAASGPDIAGQPARLRNSDGITMTPQGARKLAFFAEKPLEKVLGAGLQGVALAALPNEKKAVPQNPANATSVPAIAMNSPSLDGGDSLIEGPGGPPPADAAPSPRDRLVNSGAPLAPSLGRADDFSWGAGGAAAQASRTAPTGSRLPLEPGALRPGPENATPPKPTSLPEAATSGNPGAQGTADAAQRAAFDPSREQPGSAVPR